MEKEFLKCFCEISNYTAVKYLNQKIINIT